MKEPTLKARFIKKLKGGSIYVLTEYHHFYSKNNRLFLHDHHGSHIECKWTEVDELFQGGHKERIEQWLDTDVAQNPDQIAD